MYRYKAYGLRVNSEICIPELLPSSHDTEDVRIRYGSVRRPNFSGSDERARAERTPEGHTYYIKNIGGVCVEDGSVITMEPHPGSEEKGFRFLISGIALGLLLHQRGYTTLHASAVSVKDRAVGFIGQKGMGKSTTAAAFHNDGRPILTDDLLVLDTRNERVTSRPGFPNLKLYPESLSSSLNEDPERVPKIDPEGTKRSFSAKAGFMDRCQELGCLYVLDYERAESNTDSPLPYTEKIKGSEACAALVSNAYVPRLLPEEGVSSWFLNQCAEVIRRVPVRRLVRSPTLEDLPKIVSLIEDETRTTLGQESP